MAARLAKPTRTGRQGHLYVRSQMLDAVEFLLDDPTFSDLKSTIRAYTNGDLATSLRAFEEMEEKDERLAAVTHTRRLALTRLEWRIVSTADKQRKDREKQYAQEAAEYIEEQLVNLRWRDEFGQLQTFDSALRHLAGAIGPNLAVAEIVWNKTELAKFIPIPGHRLTLNPMDLGELWLITTEHMMGEEMPADKFVVHRPKFRPAFAYSPSISSRLAHLWLMRRLALSDWSTYIGRFGIPLIWAVTDKTVASSEKIKLEEMLENFGTSGWGHYSRGVETQIIESSQRGTAPQEAFLNYIDRQMSIAMLGQALTTDTTGETGTLAAAEVHNLVRGDLLADDMGVEAEMVRSQIIEPICRYRWPGRDVPLPEFERIIPEQVNRVEEVQVMQAAQAVGLSIPRAWALDRLKIPPMKEGDVALTPISVNPLLEEGLPL